MYASVASAVLARYIVVCCPLLQQEREAAVGADVIQAARATRRADVLFGRAPGADKRSAIDPTPMSYWSVA
eukprot:852913-Pyramimonas_sp.AAC.1